MEDSNFKTIENVKDDKIDLESITKNFKVSDLEAFTTYLKDVYIDLYQRMLPKDNEQKQNPLGLNKIIFIQYYDLPGILSDRLFSNFDTNKNQFIDINEFINGMVTLFYEDFEKNSKFIFDFYDFDNDNKISKEDIRTVLSYVSLKEDQITDEFHITYKTRVKSQEDLFNIIELCFKDEESGFLNYEKFINIIENVNSDIYLMLLLFLYQKKPFTKANLKNYENLFEKKTPIRSPEKKLVKSPIMNLTFSPYNYITRNPKRKIGTVIHNKTNFERRFFSPHQATRQKKKGMTIKEISQNVYKMLHSKINKHKLIDNENDNEINLNKNIKRATTKKEFPSKFAESLFILMPAFKQTNKNIFYSLFQKSKTIQSDSESETDENNNNLNKSSSKALNKPKFDKLPSNLIQFDEDSSESEEEEDEKVIIFEGFLYKNVDGKLKKLYFKLIHKDLYYFKNKDDKVHRGMHNLSGLFLQEEKPITMNEIKYFAFSIVYPTKTRYYYVDNEKDYNLWFEKLKLATGYTNLLDIYEVKHKLGNGKFGLVKLGINKKTNQKVAIKIMNKKQMNTSDLELVRTEIEILKICQHPNIIKLYEIFENVDYFYIIMEYCSGGDLFSYLERHGFKLKEERASIIMHKLCASIYYIHQYGICHRDLKPENVLMTSKNENSDIRLLDFGLSKIIGPNETCKEPYGTLTYCAPEILLDELYTKQVDLWSLGVMTYLMLTGRLPFHDRIDREIARKAVFCEPDYSDLLWDGISDEAKDFVKKLLKKKGNERMTIEETLDHEWIKKYAKEKILEKRNKSKDNASKVFETYSSVGENK